MLLHFFQKFFCDRVARALADHRIDSTERTKRRAPCVLDPFRDLPRRKDPQAVKAPANRIMLQIVLVVGTECMRRNHRILLFHVHAPRIF